MQAKIHKIISILNELYPTPPVPLDYTNPFNFLIAVVLSAQTTDGKVNEVTPELFSRAPTPELMSKMNIEEVQEIIRVVGLAPSKAKYIVNLSKALVERFNSIVPESYSDLESLPGVGHKTASVVRSQVFNYPSIAVDTHVHRLAIRWGLTKPTTTNPNIVQHDLESLFPMELWSRIHIQMIYYGREYCTAKTHIVSECPICYHLKYGHLSNTHYHDKCSDVSTSSNHNIDHNMDTLPISPSQPTTATATTATRYDLSPFSPKKTGKGIISYAQRMNTLDSQSQSQSQLEISSGMYLKTELELENDREISESQTPALSHTSSISNSNTSINKFASYSMNNINAIEMIESKTIKADYTNTANSNNTEPKIISKTKVIISNTTTTTTNKTTNNKTHVTKKNTRGSKQKK